MTKRLISTILMVFILASILPLTVQATDLSAGIVTTNGGNLNVRSAASSGSSVLAKMPNGSYLTLLSRSGAWWRVEYASGRYGYCHSDYITKVSGTAAVVATNGSNLNVRSGAGTGYTKIGSLAKGEQVIVLSQSGNWSRILYHGTKTGYVSSQYLSGSSNYSPIHLSVPSFKQTDSRWANVTLGNSGKTMAKIGCATTAIAMMESYRTGSVITPDAMAKKLRYTASGSVYWPSHYTAVTNSSGYLSAIYSQLKVGKPVLFGAKNSSGSQHWVVITGFTGSSSLSAAAFTIHDPGSNSRTTLQQFLNAYPNFYKYFCYRQKRDGNAIPLILLVCKLAFVQGRIEALFRKQSLMSALFHDLAVPHNQD